MVKRKLKKEKDSPRVKKLKKKARKHSIKEGIFASAQASFGNYYVSPFAIAINASSSLVALLSSITGLLGPLSQQTTPKLLKKFSRKKILSKAVLMEGLMWLPLILTAILFYKGLIINTLPLFLLLSFAIATISINIAIPAWFSWVGDLVDDRHRGRFFAKRNLIIGFVSVVLAISASFLLDYFKNQDKTMFGFIILFSLAFFVRMLSYKVIKGQYEPELKKSEKKQSSFFEFILNSPKNNLGQFSIARALIAFASSISSPLIAVYLLRNLEFNYTTYMIIIMSATLFSLFVIELWGKFSDRYGNYKTLLITTIIIPTIPILWILDSSALYLILVPSLVGGITWAGFNLSATNFIYDNTPIEKRSIGISHYNLLTGIGVFFGASLGAFLIKYVVTTLIEPIILIFLISAFVRMIVIFWWIPKIKEVRKTQKFESSRVLKNIIFKEARSTISEEVHEIMSIDKYLRA